MNLKTAMRERRLKHDEGEVDLTGVMNLFLILIPFLLLTAVFVKISILELTLPNLQKNSAQVNQNVTPKSVVLNFLFIKETGFELKSPDLKLPAIPKKDGNFDWTALTAQLLQTKAKYPDSEDIIIAPADLIKYDTIISIMDHCREAGFPNISISG